MKKVCHITTVHPPFDTRIFHKEAKTLVNAGYDVTLIVQHEKDEIIEGIKIIALPKPKNRLERFLKLDYLAYKKALQQKAEIYHFHDPELLPWMVKLKKKTGAKVIYDVHEDVSKQILTKEWIPKILRKFVAKFYLIKEKSFLPFIDLLILVADSHLKLYRDYKNVITLRNYPLISEELLKNEVKFKKDFSKLIYVGGVSKIRGLFEMIWATKILTQKFKNIQLEMVGPMEEKTKLKINELEKNIIFYGKLPHPKALQLISEANIGLSLLHPVPNYIESLPIKLFEYMAAGLPVIASNFPLWREIVEGNKCGVCVDPLNPKEIAGAVEYLIKHPDEARKMGENGRRAVWEKYNWENEAKKLVKVYEELCKK